MSDNYAGIVLAAGFSSRINGFKPLLPLGETTVIERVIALFRDSGIEQIHVVVGHRAHELTPLLNRLGVCVVLNEGYEEGMFSSVVTGVRSLREGNSAFFVLSVDIPLVRAWTIRRLLGTYTEGRSKILHPCFGHRRGHPPLIDASLADEIVRWRGPGGLKALLDQHESVALDVEVADENILFDMDSDEDYVTLQDRWRAYGMPTRQACETILTEICSVSEEVYHHCRHVEKVATVLGEALRHAGCALNLDLISAAALVHDMAKGWKRHDQEGARLLREMGYPQVADIVSSHVDIVVRSDDSISEAEVIYLADKLVQGVNMVSIEERFKGSQSRFAGESEIQRAIGVRLENARKIQNRVQEKLGIPLNAVLGEVDSL